MTVEALAEKLRLNAFVLCDGKRQVSGGYTGDLLSWVMGRAAADEAWVTIMSNNNIVAVAALTDVACILLAEGVAPDAGVAESARTRGVNVLGSEKPAFQLCAEIAAAL